jgi:hypothetical protein
MSQTNDFQQFAIAGAAAALAAYAAKPAPAAKSYLPDFRQIATKVIEMGGYVVPVDLPGTQIGDRILNGKQCVIPGWQQKATRDPAQVEIWHNENPHRNCAVVGKAEIGALWGFDDDSGILAEYESVHGVIPTYRVRTVSGNTMLLFKHNEESIALNNLNLENEKGEELFSCRTNNRYVMSAGSIAHPDNDLSKPAAAYVALDRPMAIAAPSDFLQHVRQKAGKVEQKPVAAIEKPEQAEIEVHEGGRNNFLTSRLGKLHQDGVVMPELLTIGLQLNEKHCHPPLPESEVKTIAESVNKYKIVPTGPETVIMSQTEATKKEQAAQAAAAQTAAASAAPTNEQQEQWKRDAEAYRIAYEEGIPSHTYYDMTEEEYNLERRKEFPVFPLKLTEGPKWSNDILYGDSGRIILKASEYCESHPAGMLVDLLTSFGSIIGRGPYFAIGDTKHYTNEFFIRVGRTARARKGTGRDTTDELMKLVDPVWYSTRTESGFGSGEAIIGRIKDPFEQTIKQRDNTFKSMVVPGVNDKRLCIREGEAASILVLASRTDSRADIIIRNGWDGKPLTNIVKGMDRTGVNTSARCECPHLSISADTTITELRSKMPDGAEANGFGNRFLYVYVDRVKDCPHGAPPMDWSAEAVNLHEVAEFARKVERMPKSQSARNWWSDNYTRIEHDVFPGLAGLMTARASAHISRLAMIYALIDLQDEIQLDHFLAAKRLWDYCAESALFIFNKMSKEQMHILSWLDRQHGATYPEIRDDLYHRHRPVIEIKADLDALVNQGHARLTDKTYTKL